MEVKRYKLIDLDGNEVFMGYASDIGRKYHMLARSVQEAYYKKRLLRYKYRILEVDEFEEDYKETLMLLKRYGNTNIKEEPSKVVERLKKDGIDVKVEHYDPIKLKGSNANFGECEYEESYVLTIV